MGGIITSTACKENDIILLGSTYLPDYPSGSSIEIIENNILLIGDDASQILLLDSSYQKLDSFKIANSTTQRIPKKTKHDYEASTVIKWNGMPAVAIFGSGSTELRRNVLLLPLPLSSSTSPAIINVGNIYDKLKGQMDINIEGAATINDHLVLSNRAHMGAPDNFLLKFQPHIFDTVDISTPTICRVKLPAFNQVVGISGLAYVAAKDILLFTASTEATADTYADGEIGESYLGIIRNASKAISEPEVEIDDLIVLSKYDAALQNQKIESLAVESIKGSFAIIHFVADNDDGSTKLFKMKLKLNAD